MYDLIIRHGSVVTPRGVENLSIGVSDGRIASLEPELSGSREEVDASGMWLLPGMIDVHVHFNEPGRAEWEGIATGSSALAAGGGTCFFDMPLNSSPPTIDGASFDVKRQASEGRSVTDFGLWGGLVPGDLDRLDELAGRGAVGFKAFMCSSGIPDFPMAGDATLYDGMARAARLGLPVAVHAENEELTASKRGSTATDFLNSRPVVAELEAIQRAIVMAQETGCSLHVVHVSCGRGVALVEEARIRGVDVTCETCPHYLVLTAEDMVRLGAVAKCAPPLRDAETEHLWKRAQQGGIDIIASDHSPSLPEMKSPDNFFEAWGGISGCQTTLSIVLSAGKLSPMRMAELLALSPARRFRIANKGSIEVGMDADLTLVDPEDEELLQMEDLLYRHRVSPYLHLNLRRFIRRTIVRGRTVFLDGKLTGVRAGRMVRPRKPIAS